MQDGRFVVESSGPHPLLHKILKSVPGVVVVVPGPGEKKMLSILFLPNFLTGSAALSRRLCRNIVGVMSKMNGQSDRGCRLVVNEGARWLFAC